MKFFCFKCSRLCDRGSFVEIVDDGNGTIDAIGWCRKCAPSNAITFAFTLPMAKFVWRKFSDKQMTQRVRRELQSLGKLDYRVWNAGKNSDELKHDA